GKECEDMADERNEQGIAATSEVAADVLKDRLDYIKQRNLMAVVEEQRRRKKDAEKSAIVSDPRNRLGGIR
ncbi:MAG: hypothetical protein WD492_16300, partial [Alkalispirochaeta sp.]